MCETENAGINRSKVCKPAYPAWAKAQLLVFVGFMTVWPVGKTSSGWVESKARGRTCLCQSLAVCHCCDKKTLDMSNQEKRGLSW